MYHKGGEALELAVQKSCGCPNPGMFEARLDGALSDLV